MPRDTRPREGKTTRAVIIIGALTVAIGVLFGAATTHDGKTTMVDLVISQVATAVGGGVLGAGLNTLVVRQYERDVLEEVRASVRESLAARLTSDDKELRPFRKDWYHYYQSQADGQLTWWSEFLPFEHSDSIGSIKTTSTVSDIANSKHSYTTEAGVRNGTLFLLCTIDQGNENGIVEVYPVATGYKTVYAGMLFIESWDSVHLAGKCLLSMAPLVTATAGAQLTPEDAVVLDRVWASNFKARITL